LHKPYVTICVTLWKSKLRTDCVGAENGHASSL